MAKKPTSLDTLGDRVYYMKNPENIQYCMEKNLPKTGFTILGLDPATLSGFCILKVQDDWSAPFNREHAICGLFDSTPGRYESSVSRYVRLHTFLEHVDADVLFTEDVQDIKPMAGGQVRRGSHSTEVVGGFKTLAAFWAERANIPYFAFATTVLKKHMTGKGNSSKEDTQAAVIEAYQFVAKSKANDFHNATDAVAIVHTGLNEHGASLAAMIKNVSKTGEE
jgi:Holliday junction resolvasome RuvABC endonuclease subunit